MERKLGCWIWRIWLRFGFEHLSRFLPGLLKKDCYSRFNTSLEFHIILLVFVQMNFPFRLYLAVPMLCKHSQSDETETKKSIYWFIFFCQISLSCAWNRFCGFHGNKWVNLFLPSVVSEAVLVVLFIRITREVFGKKKNSAP